VPTGLRLAGLVLGGATDARAQVVVSSSPDTTIALGVDAAQDLGGGGYLISFDSAGIVGGVVFHDEDVVQYANGAWSVAIDGSASDADWVPADLDAVQVAEPVCAAASGAAALALAGRARQRRRGALPHPESAS